MTEPLFIPWNDSYKTGIPILDEQFRALLSIINSFFFHRGDPYGNKEKILIPTAQMFKSYMKINYYTIEKLLKDAEYPFLDEFAQGHEDILNEFLKVDRKCRAATDAEGLLLFLKDYWMDRVRQELQGPLNFLTDYYVKADSR